MFLTNGKVSMWLISTTGKLSPTSPSLLRWQYGVLRQWAETPLPPVFLLCLWDGLIVSHTFLWFRHLSPTRLHSQKTGGPQPPVLPALSADAVGGCNISSLQVVFLFFFFSRKEEIQDKTKITVVGLWGFWRPTALSQHYSAFPCCYVVYWAGIHTP